MDDGQWVGEGLVTVPRKENMLFKSQFHSNLL